MKRLEAQKVLQREREEQINNKRIIQAIEIERDRREFERIVRVQQAAFCREKKELEQKQQKASIHRIEIRNQVRAYLCGTMHTSRKDLTIKQPLIYLYVIKVLKLT